MRCEFESTLQFILEAANGVIEAEREGKFEEAGTCVGGRKTQPKRGVVHVVHDRMNRGLWLKLPPKFPKKQLLEAAKNEGQPLSFC